MSNIAILPKQVPSNQPINVKSAMRIKIEEALGKKQVGETFTYEELKGLTGLNINQCRAFIAGAVRFHRSRGIVFECIREVGYKRVNDQENLEARNGKQKRIQRAIRSEGEAISTIDPTKLETETDRTRLATLRLTNKLQEKVLSRKFQNQLNDAKPTIIEFNGKRLIEYLENRK